MIELEENRGDTHFIVFQDGDEVEFEIYLSIGSSPYIAMNRTDIARIVMASVLDWPRVEFLATQRPLLEIMRSIHFQDLDKYDGEMIELFLQGGAEIKLSQPMTVYIPEDDVIKWVIDVVAEDQKIVIAGLDPDEQAMLRECWDTTITMLEDEVNLASLPLVSVDKDEGQVENRIRRIK